MFALLIGVRLLRARPMVYEGLPMRAAKRDYYELLEVTRTASDTELKVAYRSWR